MRTFTSNLLAVAGLAALALPAAAQDGPPQNGPGFAYIDSRRIFAEAPGAEEARGKFDQAMAGYQQELKKLEDELQAMVTEYEQQQVMLSPEAKQQQQEEIRAKQTAYQQRAMELEQTAAERQAELMQPIMEQVNTVIGELREERGYTMVFDLAAGAIIAADTTLNITDTVLARLTGTPQSGQR